MKKIYIIVLTTVLLCGCNSFLDVTPKGKLIPNKVQDFDELMGDPLNVSAAYPLMEMCSDNICMKEDYLTYYILSDNGKAYTWPHLSNLSIFARLPCLKSSDSL